MEKLVNMKLLLVVFFLLAVIDCHDQKVEIEDSESPMDEDSSEIQVRKERGTPWGFGGPDQKSEALSTEEEAYFPSKFLYGVTYYPWRRTKNCTDISVEDIHQDFEFMSQVARSVQIFELYCNFTPTIIQLTFEKGMKLLMGISVQTETEYQRQKSVLKGLLKSTNLSHVLAITVGRASLVNDTNKDSYHAKLYEIRDMVAKSGYPHIPVTKIDDIPEPDHRPPGSTEAKVIKVDMDPFNFHKTFDDWLDDPKVRDPEKAKRTYYTGFSFPFVFKDLNKTKGEPFPLAEPGAPFSHADTLEILSCVGLPEQWRSNWGGRPGPPGPHGPPPKLPEIRTFYHSAFDMVFEYGENDPRAYWGLADAGSRQMKPTLFKDISKKEHGFPDMGLCSNVARPYDRPHEDGRPRELLYQWIAIGVSLSMALMAFTALAGIICYRKRMVGKLRRSKESQQQLESISGNTYIRTLANYLNRQTDSYVDLISKSDYENLSALVGPDWLIEESYLRFEEIIGEGHFGIVQRATLTRYGETLDVAVKRLHVGAKNVRQFLSEGILMEQFHHPNILPLVGISFTSYYLPMIITPFMQKGDLLSFVKNGDHRLTVRQLLKFGLEIAEGMNYMHSLKLIHRDLAARNCMLDDSLSVRIADFGLCRDVSDSDSYQTARASDIPIRWMPPETIEKLEWTNKSDVWSYGIVLWELFTRGKQPYTRVPLIELRAFLRSGGRLPKPEGCPDVIYDFLKNCWHGQAEQRPAFSQLCDTIPALTQALEGEQILDLPDYYNALTVMEMSQQQVPNGGLDKKPTGFESGSK